MSQHQTLEYIKTLILTKTGINHLSPSDCKLISMSIQEETDRNISETTLKRLFGFAKVMNDFSQYTINTLLEYVEKPESNAEIPIKHLNTSKNPDRFSHLHLSAKNATMLTLSAIKNRFKIPHEYTISRSFLDFDFDFFYHSNKSFYALISQAGYGKTTCLYHLVNKFLSKENLVYAKDALLYVRAEDVLSPINQPSTIESKVKLKLGLSEKVNLAVYLDEFYKKKNGKFILVIDGISDIATTENKDIIFDRLLTLISSIGNSSAIKIIFSLRTSNWNRLFSSFKDLPSVNEKWYRGAYFNSKDNANIPQFSAQEVETILQKIHKEKSKKISPTLIEKLKYPPYLQWYYAIKDNFNFGTDIVAYEVALHFIKERIYNTTYATEKAMICRKIITLSEYGTRGKSLEKIKLIKEISTFKNAYQQLINDGVFAEEKHQNDDSISEHIQFVHPNIFEYFLFLELLENNNNVIDLEFFKEVTKLSVNGGYYFAVLLWSARHIIAKSDFNQLENLLQISLSQNKKTYLVLFITQLLGNKKELELVFPSAEVEIKFHELLATHLTHFDFTNFIYRKTLHSLVKITSNPTFSFFYQLLLATNDCIRLDTEKLNKRLGQLRELESEGEKWQINPYDVLNSIYQVMIGTPLNEVKTVNRIDLLLKSENTQKITNDQILVQTILHALIILVYNALTGKYSGNAKLAYNFFRQHPEVDSINTHYSHLASVLTNYALGEATTTFNYKDDLLKKPDSYWVDRATFVDAIDCIANSYINISKKDYEASLKHTENCFKICEENNITLGSLILCQVFANIYTEMGEIDLRNEWLNRKLFIIIDKKLDKANFQYVGN